MSGPKIALANFRRDGEGYYSAYLPTIADSYAPQYNQPIGFGSCTATGGTVRINNCAYQQNGAIPVPMANSSCACVLPNGRYGCNYDENQPCVN